MNIKEFVKEIEESDTIDCDVCGQEIWSLSRAVLLTLTDRFLLDISEIYTSEKPLLVCDACLEEFMYNFKTMRRTEHFYMSTLFNDKLLKLR